ncbi:MAG: type II toxin-antitoxin system PemK/MazF family toxin [Spirosoma sp.]|nr:type II toxin-antitoxin system PemK/MazF family toxin [Spirosoma sp.]
MTPVFILSKTYSKRRPVLIISNGTSNALDNDYIVLPITKSVRDEPFSITIHPDDVQGDLPVSSELRCDKPFTLRNSLMLQTIGVLDQKKVAKSIVLLNESISNADTVIAD